MKGDRAPFLNARKNRLAPRRRSALEKHERLELARILIARGANVRAVETKTDWSVLHDAVIADEVDIVKLLLEHGANVNATSTQKCAWDVGGYVTPLDVATGNGFTDVADVLAKAGGASFGDLHAYAGPQGRI